MDSTITTLGWKDILRPIRDGYRHLFPAPDTGPSPEERRRQRALDALKGFAYFDTFDELNAWTPASSDPLQRANTPLLPRAGPTDAPGKASVLLVHDYAGNYHDYEGVAPAGVDVELYVCEYLQYIDTFVYFSHKLACVPPPTWINTLHRNGVKALGTLLIEPQTPDSEALLRRGPDGLSFPLATKLAEIATHFNFDGWLVNIEKPFSTTLWDPHILQAFLHQLRLELHDKQLIWYDALTTTNKIRYQNALTDANVPFAKPGSSLLTNYAWSLPHTTTSLATAHRTNIPPSHIYHGIDVWAQNSTLRSTYRGGGTNTGLAVAALADVGLSAAVFAPAWSFEHFPGHGRDVERSVWEGAALPAHVKCECGDLTRHAPDSADAAVVKHARAFPAGSASFFFTDFRRAFATLNSNEENTYGHAIRAQIGAQAVLPLPCEGGAIAYHISDEEGDSCLSIHTHPTDQEHFKRLFSLALHAAKLRITYRADPNTSASIYLRTKTSTHLIPLSTSTSTHMQTLTIPIPNAKITALGIHTPPSPSPTNIRISSIALTPTPSTQNPIEITINSTHHTHPTPHTRIHWSCPSNTPFSSPEGWPHSPTTGAFAHFEVCVGGVQVGRVGAWECVVPGGVFEGCDGIEGGGDVEAMVRGVGWDGEMVGWGRGRVGVI